MEDSSLFRQTMKLTAFLLGVSVLWVGTVTLSSVLVVTHVLPDSGSSSVTTPATPGPKPASSDGPARSGPAREDPPMPHRTTWVRPASRCFTSRAAISSTRGREVSGRATHASRFADSDSASAPQSVGSWRAMPEATPSSTSRVTTSANAGSSG